MLESKLLISVVIHISQEDAFSEKGLLYASRLWNRDNWIQHSQIMLKSQVSSFYPRCLPKSYFSEMHPDCITKDVPSLLSLRLQCTWQLTLNCQLCCWGCFQSECEQQLFTLTSSSVS